VQKNSVLLPSAGCGLRNSGSLKHPRVSEHLWEMPSGREFEEDSARRY
jgi:hypothetical protein